MTYFNEKLQELDELDTLPPDNILFPTWCKEIEIFLYNSFGKDSVEYKTFKEAGIIRGIVENGDTEYRKARKSRETALFAIALAYEKLGGEKPLGLKDRIELPIQLFDAMQFHPKVVESSRKLFKDAHYRDAIYRAFVEVNNSVKNKAKSQLDGKNLMSTVFRLDNPIIKLNPLKTQSDRDEQEGFMFLYMGAMEGIRNPKAHENIIQNDPYKALKYLSLASLLIETIDFWGQNKR